MTQETKHRVEDLAKWVFASGIVIWFFWLTFYALAPEGQGLRPEVDCLLNKIIIK